MATLVERVESLEAEIEHLKSLLEGGSGTGNAVAESFGVKNRTFTKKVQRTATKPLAVEQVIAKKMSNPLEGASWLLDETGGTEPVAMFEQVHNNRS